MRPLLLTLLVLVAVSVCMTVACMGYGVVNVNVPYQDATPVQLAEQRHHSGVLDWLMLGVGLSWLVTFGAATVTAIMWVANRKRTRTEGRHE